MTILWGTISIYGDNLYDERLMALGVLTSMLLPLLIIEQIHYFENTLFKIYRGLPLSLVTRFSSVAKLMFLISLPEWTMIFFQVPGHLGLVTQVSLLLLGLSLLLMLYGYHYVEGWKREHMVRSALFSYLALFVIILTGLPLIAIALLLGAVAAWCYWNGYYRYERVDELLAE